MRVTIAMFALAGALAACGPDRQPEPPPEPAVATPAIPEAPAPPVRPAAPDVAKPVDAMTLTPAGLGDIVVGKAPPPALREESTQISDTCRTWRGAAYPDVYVITDGKVVRRVTVMRGSKAKTTAGIGVGARETAIRAAYPDIVETPHEYLAPGGKNLTARPSGSANGLRFEIDGEGRATILHAGSEPFLGYSEGCA